MKMIDVFVSENGKLIVGSIGTEIYQDIDHNIIDVVGKFETEKHAEYAAHAIKNHDRLVEENNRLIITLESIDCCLDLGVAQNGNGALGRYRQSIKVLLSDLGCQ